MTTEANPSGAASAAPNAPVQPAIATPAVQPPATQPNAGADDKDPPWLPDRLARAQKSAAKEGEEKGRKALLAELGIDDPEVVKKLVSDKKKRDEDAKSQEQKLAEYQLREQQNQARLKELEEAVKLDAAEQLTALTEEQRKAVVELAGDDPAKQRKAIAALRPTWTKPAPQAATETQTNASGSQGSSVQQGQTQQQPAPVVAPAKPASATAPGATAPPPAGTVVVPNHLETYNAMNDPKSPHYAPFSSAAYYARYQTEIVAAQKSRNAN